MRKRTQSWLLFAIAFTLVGLFYGGFTIGSMIATGQEKADLIEVLPFDRLSDFGLSIGLGFFGSVMLVIIAAGMMGNEFSWNTLRPLVARASSRTALISAKLTALLIYTVLFSLVLAALIAVLSIASSLIAGVDVAFTSAALADAVWFTLRNIVGKLPILAFAFMLATVARSNAAGIAGALGLSFIEPTAFGLLGMINDVFDSIQKWGIGWNSHDVTLNWTGSAQNWVSVGVLLVYTALFTGLSYVVFLRRDVTSG
jgi:ABC-type transport system involved in multi-copper enzyme maturation permease subunit